MQDIAQIPVTALYGVGSVKAKAYAAAGVHSILDLLYYFPRAYEDRANIKLLAETSPEYKSAVVLNVATEPKVANIKRGMSLLKFRAFDDSGICEITYFNQNYLKDKFPIGSTFRFYGKVEKEKSRFSMISPAADPWVDEMPPPPFFSVYRLSEGLSQKQISQNMEQALEMASQSLPDPLPEEIRVRHGLCSIYYALREIHFPESYTSLATAKKRLVFDEFFLFATGLTLSGGKAIKQAAPACPDTDISALRALLPYQLTSAQEKTVADIAADMSKNEQMSRIVIGDVGCGKTVCATAAIYIAVKNGYQAALMAPTEILASQHYNDLRPIFEALGIKSALLTGSCTAATKRKIHAAMQAEDTRNRLDVVIGTQALLSDGAEFINPGLVITDEQHRFGVNQRALLSEKNQHTHVLVMSATPIPRSLALVMYGDLAMSKIDEMPPGRQRVDTFVVGESYRARLQAFIRKQIGEGGQVYIVCPAIEERECEPDEITLDELFSPDHTSRPPLKAAVTYTEELCLALPELRDAIAYLHGGMKSREKDDIMHRFATGQIKILVSTTVIEVGVNVPNANLMIVENADRFGLSQLHQLRGRVGRGQRKSYCVLVSDAQGETARKRLETMRTTYDGYRIAEEDLALRGPGDFFRVGSGQAIRQSGGIRFRLADLCDDSDLMTTAATAARDLLSRDPELRDHPQLRRSVEELFCVDSGTLS